MNRFKVESRREREAQEEYRRVKEELEGLNLKIDIPEDQVEEYEEEEGELESPHTPSTPRSVPSDEDDDSD